MCSPGRPGEALERGCLSLARSLLASPAARPRCGPGGWHQDRRFATHLSAQLSSWRKVLEARPGRRLPAVGCVPCDRPELARHACGAVSLRPGLMGPGSALRDSCACAASNEVGRPFRPRLPGACSAGLRPAESRPGLCAVGIGASRLTFPRGFGRGRRPVRCTAGPTLAGRVRPLWSPVRT